MRARGACPRLNRGSTGSFIPIASWNDNRSQTRREALSSVLTHTHRARNQTPPVIDTYEHARTCRPQTLLCDHHTHVDSLSPWTTCSVYTRMWNKEAMCGLHNHFYTSFRKTQPEIHTVYMYACSSLQYETIIKHICMVQTWWGWFLPAEEAVHACSQSNRTKNKTSETFFSAKATGALLKQTSTWEKVKDKWEGRWERYDLWEEKEKCDTAGKGRGK